MTRKKVAKDVTKDGVDTSSKEDTTISTATETTSSSRPVIVDRRSSNKRLDILNQPTDYSKNPNRLSNLRWGVGQEPDGEGTSKDDGWVNIKLDVTEHLPPEPEQKSLLGGGPELLLKCFHCGKPLHIGAAQTAREILETGGFTFDPSRDIKNLDQKVVACVCDDGHVVQLREDMVRGLMVK